MSVAAIIVAAGRGERFGSSVPKQLLRIGERSSLERCLEAFDAVSAVDSIVVVLPEPFVEDPPPFLLRRSRPVTIVAGGPRRQDSVGRGFARLPPEIELIVIHDAARPFVTPALIEQTVGAAREAGAALAATPARDTLKRAVSRNGHLFVAATVPRDDVFLAQTPQAFRRDVLRDAIALGERGVEATDEAALAERAGHPVRLVDGDPRNLKLTMPEDFAIAEALVHAPGSGGLRIGVGYDLHRTVEGRPLVLGGVTVPFDRGLAGHSDADALCHAVTDAVLGAARAGDIGRHFPDDDPRWKDASSIDLLRRAAEVVREFGYLVENVDAVVIAERPKIGPYAARMEAALAGALGVSAEQIAVKAKTQEGIGEIGRGEAIAVHAVALLRKER